MPCHEHHTHASERRRYINIFLVTLLILVVQVTGGWISGSLALWADSVHVALDGVSALISVYVASVVHRYENESRLRRRWMRVSGVLLLASLAWLGYEAVERLIEPTEVIGRNVVVIALIGALLNWWQHSMLPHHHHDNETTRAQRLHIMSDFGSSIAVAVGGAIMWMTEWYRVDAILTLGVIAWIGYLTLKMLFSKR